MPVIDVHSAVTSGQLAPSSKASGDVDRPPAGRFDRVLADKVAGGSKAPARDDATAAEMASGRAPITADASGVQPGSDAPRLGPASAPLAVNERAAPLLATEVSAPDDAIAVPIGDRDTIVATSVEPSQPATAHAAASRATVLPRTTPVAATISLGSGPVQGAAVIDGLTLIAEEDPAAPSIDDGTVRSRSNTTAQGQKGAIADVDGSTAEGTDTAVPAGTAAAALIPLVAATHAGKAVGAMQAEAAGATGKLVSASLVAKAPAGARNLIDAADVLEETSRQTKDAGLGDRTPPIDMAANMPASAGTHRAASSLPLHAIPLAMDPAAAGATPLSAAVARSGAGDSDAAALHHVERLYAPHEGAIPTGSAAAFARLGTIGQDTGVALARGVAGGRDHVAIRLDPPDLGRIDVQLSFGQDGGLRAVVASDNRAALDLLRRDLDQLQRALADAGVRADAQSFHFSERQSGGSQRWDTPVARDQRYAALADPAAEPPSAVPSPRRLRSSGLIDVFA